MRERGIIEDPFKDFSIMLATWIFSVEPKKLLKTPRRGTVEVPVTAEGTN